MTARLTTTTVHPVRSGPRHVVAVALTWRGRIGLFKRSQTVGHDQGRWHCISGYLEPGTDPLAQALTELHEETGLHAPDLTSLTPGPVLTLPDQAGNHWTIHTFQADTTRRRLTLNWEHDAYRWVRPHNLSKFHGQVSWLNDVLLAFPLQQPASGRSRPIPTPQALLAH